MRRNRGPEKLLYEERLKRMKFLRLERRIRGDTKKVYNMANDQAGRSVLAVSEHKNIGPSNESKNGKFKTNKNKYFPPHTHTHNTKTCGTLYHRMSLRQTQSARFQGRLDIYMDNKSIQNYNSSG